MDRSAEGRSEVFDDWDVPFDGEMRRYSGKPMPPYSGEDSIHVPHFESPAEKDKPKRKPYKAPIGICVRCGKEKQIWSKKKQLCSYCRKVDDKERKGGDHGHGR